MLNLFTRHLFDTAMGGWLLPVAAVAAAQAPHQITLLPPSGLRVEYIASPAIGIDVPRPRFSWTVSVAEGGRAVYQFGYRLQVSTSLNWSCSDKGKSVRYSPGCVMDSGQVNSTQHWGVHYNWTTPLANDTTYFWRVMWWAKCDGGHVPSSPWSLAAQFDTGFIGGAFTFPNSSQWLGTSEDEFNANRLGTTQLRGTFELPPGAIVTRARAFVASPGYYSIAIDGNAGSDAALGSFTVFTRRILYDVLDVTATLNPRTTYGFPTHTEQAVPGDRYQETTDIRTEDASPATQHVVAITLGNGWYSQPTVALGPRTVSLYMSIAYVLPDGHANVTVVVTDSSWVVTAGPTTLSDIYLGATYDARLATPGWDKPGFVTTATRWHPATVHPSPLVKNVGLLRSQIMPRIRRCETFQPQSTRWFSGDNQTSQGVWVVDFGQNMAGTVEITIPGVLLLGTQPGTNITVRHAEMVWPNGTLHHLYGRAVSETLTVIVTTQSRNGEFEPDDIVYEPRFTYMGFRYVEISGSALSHVQGVDIPVRVVAHFTHTDLEQTGRIETSSNVLSGIVHAAKSSQLGSWMSLPTGCTQRERRGWLGDASLAAEGQTHTFFAAPAYAKFLDDIADTQSDEWAAHNGSIPEVCPNYGHGANPPDPPFGVGYAVIWWTHYRSYSDIVALAAHYPRVAAFAETLLVRANGFGTRAGVLNVSTHGDWVSVANQSDFATTCSGRAALDHYSNATCCLFMECPDGVVSGFYYVLQFRILFWGARELGKDLEAARWAALAQSAADILRTSYYNRQTKTLGYGFQTDQALALALSSQGGVLPKEDVSHVARELAADVDRQNGHLNTGIFGTKWLLPALSAHGYSDKAIGILTQTTPPSWGAWVAEHNATTLFEMWGAYDGDPPSSGTASHNHVMFSTFLPWLYQVVVGIAMDADDFGTGLVAAPMLATNLSIVTGYERFRVAPRLVGPLVSASAQLETIRGRIAAGWFRSPMTVYLNVTLPVGQPTLVTVPLQCLPSTAVVLESGTVVWNHGHFVAGVVGVKLGQISVENDDVILSVGSGTYYFEATCS